MGFSTKKKRGRPKVQRTPHDYGNERVQARSSMFRAFGGDASKGHEFSCAGRLMLVGAFDGMEQEPAAYLSALLEYANGYWGHYASSAPKVAQYERSDRSYDNGWDDPRGEWFDAMDNRLRGAGYHARRAVQAVTVDRHFFPDEDVDWAARIINTRFVAKNLPVCGELACDSDWAMLELLRLGAMALVGNQLKARALAA